MKSNPEKSSVDKCVKYCLFVQLTEAAETCVKSNPGKSSVDQCVKFCLFV